MLGWSFTVIDKDGRIIDYYEEGLDSKTLELLKSGEEVGYSEKIEDHGGYPDKWFVPKLGWTYEVWDQS